MKKSYLFTSEAVSEGHPDRLCDTISDAVVDRFLQKDPYSRIVAECALSKSVVFVAARFASTATVDIPEVARSVIKQVGYRLEDFDAANCTVVTSLITMPMDQRAQADEEDLSEAELDRYTVRNQATVFGFACTQTPELMPLPVSLANRLARQLSQARRSGRVDRLSPDCTTQVGVEYLEGKPARIHGITIIAGLEGGKPVDPVALREKLGAEVIVPVFEEQAIAPDESTEIFINPQGAFPRSGPSSHSGMTGRKTSSDTYGAYARHSGSALSGKDPSRIDRVGAYMARYVAKNIVAAGLAEQCEVQLSYSIGHAAPVSVQVETFGTGNGSDATLSARIQEVFDFRLGAIIRDFNLRHLPTLNKDGFYQKLPAGGHLGDSLVELPWELTDKAEALR
ncbi:MAG: methionine adenosyltransferase [Methylococcaceae bacterium]|nr:methionine adenosyltransferase [Methylococcaceae bacterium]